MRQAIRVVILIALVALLLPYLVARLNFDGAKAQGDTPMGGTWRNPMRDRADVRPKRWGRRH